MQDVRPSRTQLGDLGIAVFKFYKMEDWLDVTHRPKFAEPHTPSIGDPLVAQW